MVDGIAGTQDIIYLQKLHDADDCGLELFSPAQVEAINRTTDSDISWPSVQIEGDDEPLSARLIVGLDIDAHEHPHPHPHLHFHLQVGADGARSLVKRACDIGTAGRSYMQQ